GVRSIRCTYSVARVLPRFTFTTNFVFFIVSHCFDYTRVSAFIAPKPRRIAWKLLHGLGLRGLHHSGCLHNSKYLRSNTTNRLKLPPGSVGRFSRSAVPGFLILLILLCFPSMKRL